MWYPSDERRPNVMSSGVFTGKTSRLSSIDLTRGVVVILMTLDHVRDYFSHTSLRIDFDKPSSGMEWLLFTRVITHLCAPTFIFLAGTSAFLALAKSKDKKQTRRLFFQRGLWFIFLELTIVRFAWSFNLSSAAIPLAVIWAIGCAMIALVPLTFLSTSVVGVLSLLIIAGHNLLDGVSGATFGVFEPIWNLFHVAFVAVPSIPKTQVIYPILPWIGVMAAGYAVGPLFLRTREERRKILFRLGWTSLTLFFTLRFFHGYGDAHPWVIQETNGNTLLAFFNATKYPPSLHYLSVTLGIMLIFLAAVERDSVPKILQPAITFGRVPMFYYILHLYLIHASAAVLAWLQTGDPLWMLDEPFYMHPVDAFGFQLPGVYVTWVLIVLSLYPVCKWYDGYKGRSRKPWLAYL